MMKIRARRYSLGALLSVALIAAPLHTAVAENAASPNAIRNAAPPLTTDQIVARLVEKNAERANALESFQSRRSYRLDYAGFPENLHAEMVVDMTFKAPNTKEFTVVSESGNKWIVNHIFKRLLESEREAMNTENRTRTELNEQNYNFTLLSGQSSDDGCSYVLGVAPKSPSKFLYRGRIWVDTKDFAVCRIEAEPAKNPSFWIRKTDIHHAYEKVGDFWLPAGNKSVSNIRLGGLATLTIKYEEYKILQSHALNATHGQSCSLKNVRAGIKALRTFAWES